LLLGSGVQGLAFSPDGRSLATSDEHSSEGVVWDVASARVERTLAGHSAPLRTIAYSPDGRLLATASEDKTVRLWDAATGESLRVLRLERGAFAIAFHPNGRAIATLDWSGAVRLWEVDSGREVRRMSVPVAGNIDSFGDALAFDRDGRRLAVAADDGSARIFSTESGRELRALRGHSGEVHCVAFSPDGRRLVTAASDATLKLWDAATGEEFFALRGHSGEILGVAFSPDGRLLASAGTDGEVRIWSGEPTPPNIRRGRRASETVDALLLQPLSAEQKHARLRGDRALDEPTRAEAIAIARQLYMGEFGFGRAADTAARMGRWPEVAAAYAILASWSRPGEPVRHLAALSRLRCSDLPGYRALCAAELDGLGPSPEPDRAKRVAQSCVIGPAVGPGPDANAVIRLAESAVTGSSGPLHSAALSILGAALYRAGRYDAAILRLNESRATGNGPETVRDWAFLAMSHYRAGDFAESRRWTERLAGWAPASDPVRFWDDVEVGLLRDEALALARTRQTELPDNVFAR
jgi:sugar lactone lactonase YvrE